MSDHWRHQPRWPSETPGGKGGEWRGEGGWVGRISVRLPQSGWQPGNWAETDDSVLRAEFAETARKTMLRWTTKSSEEIEEQIALDLEEVEPPATVFQNGPHIVRVDRGLKGVTPQDIQAVLETIDDLQAANPAPKPMRIRIARAENMLERDSAGETIRDGGPMMISEIIFDPKEAEQTLQGHGFMPIRKTVSWVEYVVAHEWGHTIDHIDYGADTPDEKFVRDAMDKSVPGELSRYAWSMGLVGRTEAYAEMFAEWFLSRGQTKRHTVRVVAEHFGWGVRGNG